MNEASVRQKVLRDLEGKAIPVENPVFPGTPDIWSIWGWIELKYVQTWPKRSNLNIEHFTPQQKHFLHRFGGFVFIRVEDDYLLFNGHDVLEDQLQGGMTKDQLIKLAFYHWTKKIPSGQLEAMLCTGIVKQAAKAFENATNTQLH